jgi:hypothetical protein
MIKKEVTPLPSIPAKKVAPQKVGYKYAGKESLGQSIKKSIPAQLIPTKRVGTIFGAIFILVLIIAAFQFPFSAIMSGNLEATIQVGYPWRFMELELAETSSSPIKPIGLLLDLIIYIVLAYGIDIILSLMLRNPLLQSNKQFKQRPVVFKDQKSSIVGKAAEKITDKVYKNKK